MLVGIAYGTVVILFLGVLATSTLTAADAWDMLEAPLMALIGGSLTLSLQLLKDEHESSKEDTKNLQNEQPKTENQAGASVGKDNPESV